MTIKSQQSDEKTGGQVAPRVETEDRGPQVSFEPVDPYIGRDDKLSISVQICNAFKINSFKEFTTKLLSSFLAAVALIFSENLSKSLKNITEGGISAEEKPDSLGNIQENAKKITEELDNNNNNEREKIFLVTALFFFIKILVGGLKRLCLDNKRKTDASTQVDTTFAQDKYDGESDISGPSNKTSRGGPSSSLGNPCADAIGRPVESFSI